MNAIIANALAGLNTARQRLEISAANIASADAVEPLPAATADAGAWPATPPLDPRLVRRVVPDSPAANPDGLVATPIVDLASEGVNQLVALNTYEANLRVIKVAQALEQEAAALLDHHSHDITA